MKTYLKKDIKESLLRARLKKNDVVFVNPQLFEFGKMDGVKNKEDYYKSFFEIIMNIIGKNGTLVTNTYSFQTARGNPRETFIYEKTKCSCGTFAEFVRQNKMSIRSENPVFSVSAVGKYKSYICKNNSIHNYGYGSPYQRFLELNGKILNLAIEPAINPFLHIAEFLVGVPYNYNKIMDFTYYKNKKKIKKRFVSSVRFLNLDLKRDTSKINKEIKKKLLINTSKLGTSNIFLFNAKDYLNVAIQTLNKDIFAFHKKIKKKKNQYPLK